MIYKVNSCKLTLKVNEIIDSSDSRQLVCTLYQSPSTTLVCNLPKIPMYDSIEKGGIYTFAGHLRNTSITIGGVTHALALKVSKFFPYNKKNKPENLIEFLCTFRGKTKVHNIGEKKVCNVYVDYFSDYLTNRDLEIAVWNQAVDSVSKAKVGQKIHMSTFIKGNCKQDDKTSLKVCPFKLTLL